MPKINIATNNTIKIPHFMVKSSLVNIAYKVKEITIARVMIAATITTGVPFVSATITHIKLNAYDSHKVKRPKRIKL